MFAQIGPWELTGMALVAVLLLGVPSFIARRRRVRRLSLVVVINVLGAFTGVFWFVALFMALSMATRDSGPLPAPDGRPGV